MSNNKRRKKKESRMLTWTKESGISNINRWRSACTLRPINLKDKCLSLKSLTGSKKNCSLIDV